MVNHEASAEFRKKLMHLMIPISLQQLMLALVNASDAFMLGFLSQDALSAVSLAGQIQFVYSLFLFAITAGVSIFAAQYWGIQDRDSVEKTLGIGLAASVLISLPFTIGASFFPEQLMRIFASDPVLIEDGAAYLRVVGISYFLLSISQIYLCILKNCGECRHQFRFRSHQHFPERRFYFRHWLLSGNGNRRRSTGNCAFQGDRAVLGTLCDAEKGLHQDSPALCLCSG